MPELLPFLRLFNDASRTPVDNMAMDEALYLNEFQPILRFYDWDIPAVSLGYFCSWAEAVERHGDSFSYVRRWTGGGTVEHGGADATYALTLPESCEWSRWKISGLYQRVHTALAEALAECGTATDFFEVKDSARGGACFQHPVARDLAVAGKKVAGAAVRRTTSGVLLQGSLQGIAVPDELPAIFARHLAEATEPWDPGTSLDETVAMLVHSRYGRQDWTRRR